jgi:hypothetical protein
MVLRAATRMTMFRALQTLIMASDRDRGRATLRSRTRPQRSPWMNAPSGGWVEIKLTETPDTDPCTQAPVSWRNDDKPSKWMVRAVSFGEAQQTYGEKLLPTCQQLLDGTSSSA